jgi:hypothetical protein
MLSIGLSYIVLIMLVASGFLTWEDVEFCQRFFCNYWNDHVFNLDSVYWFAYVELALHALSETNLIMVYDLLKYVFEFSLWVFYWEFCVYVPLRSWSIIFFFLLVFILHNPLMSLLKNIPGLWSSYILFSASLGKWHM